MINFFKIITNEFFILLLTVIIGSLYFFWFFLDEDILTKWWEVVMKIVYILWFISIWWLIQNLIIIENKNIELKNEMDRMIVLWNDVLKNSEDVLLSNKILHQKLKNHFEFDAKRDWKLLEIMEDIEWIVGYELLGREELERYIKNETKIFNKKEWIMEIET